MFYVSSVTTTQQKTAFVAARTIPKTKTLHLALWILQVLWGIFFCFTGFLLLSLLRVFNHIVQRTTDS